MKKKAELVEEIEHWKRQCDKYLDKIDALELALEGEIEKSGDIREELDRLEKKQRRMMDFHA